MKKYIMAIDQGTTGSRVIFFDYEGQVHSNAYKEIHQIFPQPGWVEHDPLEYWQSVYECTEKAMEQGNINPNEIAAIGITNQRETTILWDKETGQPVHNAIVWQCRRTADMCEQLIDKGFDKLFREKTGLVIDAYFSGTKIKWIIDNVPGVKEKIEAGKICMGTVDSWLIWKLTGGTAHVTDYSNASRTLLLNIHDKQWDDELLNAIGIPPQILPKLCPTSGVMATTNKNIFFDAEIPIAGVAGDQHAALFGQTCFKPGMAKNTYGTALALMLNIGDKPIPSTHGLTTNLAWHINGKTEYSFEGVVFIGGAAVQWLRDGIGVIKDATQCNELAAKVENTGKVYFVPAFTGLCAPYWDMHARGLIIGITGGTKTEHLARAALESMAYQTRDVLDAMVADCGKKVESLRVDGGATKSEFLMQFQADILGIPIERPAVTEMAALGAAYLAGLAVGFWKSKEDIEHHWKIEKVFEAKMSAEKREELYDGWKKAIQRSFNWAKE